MIARHQRMRIDQQPHPRCSLQSSSGSSKAGAIASLPFMQPKPFHKPALARWAGSPASSIFAFTLTGCAPSPHPAGSGKCSVPSGDGVKMAEIRLGERKS